MRTAVMLLTLSLAITGCGDKPAKELVAAPTVEKRDTVVFAGGSPQLASIQVAAVEPRRETTLKFPGRLIWDEDRTVRIFSPFAGRVISISARAGDAVKAGQSLAVIGAPELGMAQSEARKTEQDYALAQKNLARIQELHGAGVAPLKDLQAAQADVARTKAERDRTIARMKLYGTAAVDAVNQQYVLRSPITGVVVERNLNPGQEARADAQPDKAFFVVSDPTRLWFLLDVAEGDVGAVKAGLPIQISSTALGEDKVSGRIVHVADVVDAQSRTVKIRGTVDNPDQRLKAEMYVVGEARVAAVGGYVVPSHAVYLRGEQYFVFVAGAERAFIRKAVRPGPSFNGHQVILEGLSANDKIVVEGNLLLERILASKD